MFSSKFPLVSYSDAMGYFYYGRLFCEFGFYNASYSGILAGLNFPEVW
jgi:hypothetical protein